MTSQYKTPEGGFVKDAPYWTVAWRNPRANRFLRADLGMTWTQAHDLAGELAAAHPELQVFYTTNALSETDGHTNADDAGNIMVDSGRRIRIVDTTADRYPAALTAKLAAAETAAARHADSAAYHQKLAAKVQPGTNRQPTATEAMVADVEAAKARQATRQRAADAEARELAADQRAQTAAWLDRYQIALRELTEEDAARVAREYHAAMAADYDAAVAEDQDRTSYSQTKAWTERHNLVSGHPEVVAVAVDADHAEALRQDDGREAYAHAGYRVPLTPAELAAGYADWDRPDGVEYAERGRCIVVGQARRRVLDRLAELAAAGTPGPLAALEAFARGEFGRAMAWLRQDVLDDLAAAEQGIAERVVRVISAAVAATPGFDTEPQRFIDAYPVGSRYGTGQVIGHSVETWEIMVRQPDGTTHWRAADRPGPAVDPADESCGYSLTPLGEAALAVAHEPAGSTRGLCLRTDAEHVGHMSAVGDECRTEVHTDPYDAASEAVGRSFSRGYALGGPMNPDGTYATWGLPN